jgi:hypothetical protein
MTGPPDEVRAGRNLLIFTAISANLDTSRTWPT